MYKSFFGHHEDVVTLADVVVILGFLMAFFLTWTLTNFVRFHIRLVWENYTTIENLEREDGQRSKFDIGARRNLEQVLGSNLYLGGFPSTWCSHARSATGYAG